MKACYFMLFVSVCLYFPRAEANLSPVGKSSTHYCEISSKDLAIHPLDKGVDELIKKSCLNPSLAWPQRLQDAMKGVSPEIRSQFIYNLSESHPDAQKRLFNKINSFSSKQLKSIILNIARIGS
jgi:hypothetical protein